MSADLLRERVCIVSGVGPGTGRAIAVSFAREGAKLVLACRSEAAGREVAAEVEKAGAKAIAVSADVTKEEDRARLIEAAIGAFDRIDVLVNNAFATGRPGPIEGADIAKTWRAAFEVNVFGTMQLSQAVIPAMKKAGGGSIVNVGTLASRKPQPGLAGYGASKAALLAATQSLAAELGRYKIRVNSVVPGHIDGPNLRIYIQREAARLAVSEDAIYDKIAAEGVMAHVPTSEEVAEAVTFFASGMAAAITGQTMDVNCGQFVV
jgi:NAD(P)-dependent dehydrogenase (short-subunit alcohol dehydrogenase family)